jgi:hypothetical protein
VDKLTSILAVLDGSSNDVPLLAKAARLALAFGARVELFSCDSEHAYVARGSHDARGVHDALKAVDESNEDTAGLAALVIRSAELMRVACGGELELLFAESAEPDEPSPAACPVGAAHFASERRVHSERIRPPRAGPDSPEQVLMQGLELLVFGSAVSKNEARAANRNIEQPAAGVARQ